MCRVPLLMMAAAIHACNGGRIAENRVPGVSMLAGFIVPARFRAGVPSGLWGRRPTRCRLARLRACSNVEEGEEERFGDGDYYSAPSSPPAFSHMGRKTIGVDYGLRRTGCCVSVGYAPRPLPLILHKDEPVKVAAEIAAFAKRESAQQIVVGMPLNTRGEEGEQANSTRLMVGVSPCDGPLSWAHSILYNCLVPSDSALSGKQVNALAEAAPACTIYLWDERFSSAIAKEKLQEAGYKLRDMKQMKGVVDVMASIGILQDFYDKGGQGAEVAHEAVVVNVSAEESSGGSNAQRETRPPQKSYKDWQAEARRQAQHDAELSRKKGKKRK